MTKLNSFLIAKGWRRDDGPADLVPECGAETNISICHNSARWSKRGCGPLCAQHARRAEGALRL